MITQRINIQLETEICQKYKDGVGIAKLSKFYHKHPNKIKDILIKNKILLRKIGSWMTKYSVNRNFFKQIDTEEKAYFLGFLYADGCIAKYSVNLSIDQKDIDILEKFKTAIEFSGPIEVNTYKINYGDKYGIKESKMAKLRIHGEELRTDLAKLGCLSRKTFILEFPNFKQVPKKLMSHFIRGYFDGDGSVFIRKYTRIDGEKRGYASITSSTKMISGIKKYLIKKCHIKKNSLFISPHKSKGISILTLASFEAMKIFRNFIYKNSTVYLQRKKDKFYILNLEKISSQCKSYENKILECFQKNNVPSMLEFLTIGLSRFVINRTLKSLLMKKLIYISETRGSGRRKYFKLNGIN